MMRLRYFVLLVVGFYTLAVNAQRLAPEKYWIPLTNKSNNTYSLDDPGSFLSERALQRREVQSISISEEDLPVTGIYVDSLKHMGLHVLGTSRWFNAVIVQTTDTSLLDTLAATIDFIEPFDWQTDYFYHGPGKNTQDLLSGDFGSTLPESENYGLSNMQIALLNGNTLHDLDYRGKSIEIAVIDAGFYRVDSLAAFDYLRNQGRLLGTHDFVNPGGNIYNESRHGMEVLSTMAAYLPGTMVGTAPEASYWLLRSEDVKSEYRIEEANWLMAAEYADSAGADIISSSLGYSTFTDSLMNYDYAMLNGETALVTRAAEKAFSKGMLVVVSAGNEGNDPWGYITTPADGKNVLAVGAVSDSRIIAYFSSRGPTSDNRVKPDVDAVGYQTIVMTATGETGQGYGTSFAAPQVAGMAACLWEAFPSVKNTTILTAIRRSADRFANPDTAYGYGIPDFMLALWSIAALDSTAENPPLIAYPNPFSSESGISIMNATGDINQIHVFSTTGKLVYSGYGPWKRGENIPIGGVTNFSAGIYFLVARTLDKEYVVKLVKQ